MSLISNKKIEETFLAHLERIGPLNSGGILSKDYDKNWMAEKVNHPTHYGGADNPYEAIKVIEAWDLGFNLGNTVKYISRAGKKDDIVQDLEKAKFYLEREIQKHKNIKAKY